MCVCVCACVYTHVILSTKKVGKKTPELLMGGGTAQSSILFELGINKN